jgi:SRSO17 transposase
VIKLQITQTGYDPDLLERWRVSVIDENNITQLLKEYASQYSLVMHRSSQRMHFENYLRGLMSELSRKSVEPIALCFVGESGVRSMQQFMKRSPLDDEAILEEYQKILAAGVSNAGGMLSVDGSDFVKKGKHSVGVGRQYCGSLGKVESCQAGVFCAYVSANGYGLVDRELYFQEKWFGEDFEDLREVCAVPKDKEFQTKNQIALTQLQKITAKGLFDIKWFGCDSAFGCDHDFLDSLPKDIPYFAAVKSNERIFLSLFETYPVAIKSIADNAQIPWERVRIGDGSKGAIYADVKIIRAISCRTVGKTTCHHCDIWVYVRKYENGDIKFFISNAPETTTDCELREAATLRWPIEQCFAECKGYLGMEHYEGRSYNGLLRHWLFVMIAHFFITSLRLDFKKQVFP